MSYEGNPKERKITISLSDYKKLKSSKGRFYPKGIWLELGGIKRFYRSKMEANYAKRLQWLKENGLILGYEHEPKTFYFEKIKSGVRAYKPDFRVHNTDGTHEWHEVKGYMDKRSETKIKRFHKYYPYEKLVVITKI